MDYLVPDELHDNIVETLENIKRYRDKHNNITRFCVGYFEVAVNHELNWISIRTLGITWSFDNDFTRLNWIHCNGRLDEKSIKVIFKILAELNEILVTGYEEKQVDQEQLLDLIMRDSITNKKDNFCEVREAI